MCRVTDVPISVILNSIWITTQKKHAFLVQLLIIHVDGIYLNAWNKFQKACIGLAK